MRLDSIEELALGVYYSNEKRWTDKVRTTLGVRFDHFDFNVTSDLALTCRLSSDHRLLGDGHRRALL